VLLEQLAVLAGDVGLEHRARRRHRVVGEANAACVRIRRIDHRHRVRRVGCVEVHRRLLVGEDLDLAQPSGPDRRGDEAVIQREPLDERVGAMRDQLLPRGAVRLLARGDLDEPEVLRLRVRPDHEPVIEVIDVVEVILRAGDQDTRRARRFVRVDHACLELAVAVRSIATNRRDFVAETPT
jgi:hypothetical protein